MSNNDTNFDMCQDASVCMFSNSSFVEIRMPIEDGTGLVMDHTAPPSANPSFLAHAVLKKKEFVQTIAREVFLSDLRSSFPTDAATGRVAWSSLWEQFSVDVPRQQLVVDGVLYPRDPRAALDAIDKGVRKSLASPPSTISSVFSWLRGVPRASTDPSLPPHIATQELVLFCQQSVLALAYQMLMAEYTNVFMDVHLVCSTTRSEKMVIEVVTHPTVTLRVEKTFHMVRIDEQGNQQAIGQIAFELSVDALDPTAAVMTTWKFADE